MQTVRETWVKQSHENLFCDHYGILKLAAHATLAKTPVSSKMPGYFSLKRIRWVSNIFATIKRLCQGNTSPFSDFIWLEPDVLTYEIIDESRTKTAKKAGIPFRGRGGKKINYKRRSK